MIISLEKVKELIPQRAPILMVDQVLEYSPGKSILTSKWVGPDADPFKGHFPGFAILPGVFLIEAAAQTGALMMALDRMNKLNDQYKDVGKSQDSIGVLGGSKVRFKKPVFPKTRLFFSGIVEWQRSGSMSLKVKAYDQHEDTLMVGSVTLSTVLKSRLTKKTKDETLFEVI